MCEKRRSMLTFQFLKRIIILYDYAMYCFCMAELYPFGCVLRTLTMLAKKAGGLYEKVYFNAAVDFNGIVIV